MKSQKTWKALLVPHCPFKAFLPVCMMYTAWGESQGANIAQGRVLYLSQDSHQELYISYKQSGSALSVLLYFTLAKY